MIDISITPLFEIRPPEFDGWLRLYQEVDKSGFWVKQNEINTLIGYSRGAVCYDTDDSFIIKIHDESGKLMNFVGLTLCQDYIMDLPSVGKKRENARKLIAFFRNLKQKLFAINGIEAVKSEYETREVSIEPMARQPRVQKTETSSAEFSAIIAEKDKEIERLNIKISHLKDKYIDTFENFFNTFSDVSNDLYSDLKLKVRKIYEKENLC